MILSGLKRVRDYVQQFLRWNKTYQRGKRLRYYINIDNIHYNYLTDTDHADLLIPFLTFKHKVEDLAQLRYREMLVKMHNQRRK